MMTVKSAFKRMIGKNAEDGQAIVLIALFMVVMLAMVGVAIDGGGLFLMWRDAQNAADTAALQAAFDRCTTDDDTTWVGVGEKAADVNGFDDTDDDDAVGSDFGADIVVTVQETPINGTDYVHVIIEAEKPSYFIQLVYRGPLEVKAEAMVYCSDAVDFSKLPGMVGFGDCTCPGNSNWNQSVAAQGARFELRGDVHSNCGLKLNSGNHDNSVTGDATSTDGIDTNSNTEITGDANGAAEREEIPAEIPIDIYFPDGEIYEEIFQTQGDDYVTHITDTSASITENNYPVLEGLWAAEGDITFQNWDGSFGERGFTVVARGKIEGIRTNHGGSTCLENWCYYGHAAETTGDPGVTVRWSRGNGSALVFYSGLDSRPACSSSTVGINLGGNGDDDDLDVVGFVYAPRSGIDWSGSSVGAKGPIMGYRLSFSGADFLWIPEPSYSQPMAPVMNNAEQN